MSEQLEKSTNFWETAKSAWQTMISGRSNWSERDQDADAILNSDAAVRRFGYGVIFIFFVGGGAWSTFAPMESAAQAAGTVQVRGDRKAVEHLEGGIVAEILVANGDWVGAGDALLRFDATVAQADLNSTVGRLWAKRAQVDRLLSERDEEEALVFSPSLLDQNDERAKVVMASERALFNARRADRFGELEVIDSRIAQLESEISGLYAVHAARESVSASIQAEIDDLRALLAEGYVDKQRLRELERSLAQILGEIHNLESSIAAADVAINEANLQKLQLDKRFKTSVVEALTQALDQLYDLEQRHSAIQDRVARTLVRAPVSGVVMALKPNTIGAVISPGEELLSIVPDINDFIIDARMSPLDIDRIKIGQEAEVRFSIFKDAYTVTGYLISLSADSLEDEVTGEPYYQAKIQLLEEDMHFLSGYTLVPGMPAQVLVKTGSRTFLGYLTSPIRRAFSTAMIED